MRIYLSGKMSSLPDLNKPKFEKYEALLVAKGHEVINPHKINFPDTMELTWENYMKEDLKHMLNCDMVAALDDWKESKGALVEIQLARDLNIPVVNVDTFQPIRISRKEIEFEEN